MSPLFFLLVFLPYLNHKMKFSITAVLVAAISAVCAQSSAAPAAPANAGIATTHPGLGVSSNMDHQTG